MGTLGPVAKESAILAIDFVAANVGRLRAWMKGCGSSSIAGNLFRTFEDITVAPQGYNEGGDGASGTAAMALSVIVRLGRLQQLIADVAITGYMDLTGAISPVLDVEEKIRAAKEDDVDMVIIPAQDFHNWSNLDFEPLAADLRDYARGALHPARTMVDVMELTIPGESLLQMHVGIVVGYHTSTLLFLFFWVPQGSRGVLRWWRSWMVATSALGGLQAWSNMPIV